MRAERPDLLALEHSLLCIMNIQPDSHGSAPRNLLLAA